MKPALIRTIALGEFGEPEAMAAQGQVAATRAPRVMLYCGGGYVLDSLSTHHGPDWAVC
jgi:hypothetical protein